MTDDEARRLAEAGLSVKEIQKITGHTTLAEVQRYVDAADKANSTDENKSRRKSFPTCEGLVFPTLVKCLKTAENKMWMVRSRGGDPQAQKCLKNRGFRTALRRAL
jgi:hypothetical protein